MAYNNNTMKLIDGMMPPTTTDKASYSTKTTNEQANTSADQRNAVETRAYKYKEAMKNKGISYADYHYIVKATGSTTAAENAVINAPASILNSMIKAEKSKENKPKLPTTTPTTTTKPSTIKPTTSSSPTVEDVDDEVVAESLLVQVQRNRQEDIDNNYNGDQGAYWIERFNQQTDNLVNARLETEMKNKGIDENEYKALQSYYMSIVKAKDAVLNMSQLKLEKILEEIADEKAAGLIDNTGGVGGSSWSVRKSSPYSSLENSCTGNACVFYDPKEFYEQVDDQAAILEKQGYNVDKIALASDDDFVEYWNENADKYDSITLLTHGGPHGISMGVGNDNNLVVRSSGISDTYDDEKLKQFRYVDELNKGSFDINLLSCDAGHSDHDDDNLAHAFDDVTSGKVLACDGNVSYYPISSGIKETLNDMGSYILENIPTEAGKILINLGEKVANFVEEKTGINFSDVYPEDEYEPRLSSVFNQDSFIKQLDKVNIVGINIPKLRTPKGFYYLDDEEKTYK